MESPISARTAILLALVKGKGFGLELIERVRDRTNGAVKLGQGSVYPLLRELEDDGMVKSHEADPTPERGGRPRRYYELTGEGRKAALEQRTTLVAMARFAGAV